MSDYQSLEERWKRKGVENIDWKSVFGKIDKSLNCTKLKWLQFRTVNNILTTNKSVSKFNRDQSPLCTFCRTEEEDVIHLFYGCNKVRDFWKKLENEIISKCPNISLTEIPMHMIVFGLSTNFHSTSVFDLILVMAKLYIYRQKGNKENLFLKAFLSDIKTRYLAETLTANLEGKKTLS